jgi:hypothetical protein
MSSQIKNKNEISKIAFHSLFPNININLYIFEIKYSNKFGAYNANVRYEQWNRKFTFNLSKKWQGVSEEIVVGLIQHLILRIKKIKRKTLNTELYEIFIKNVNNYVKKDKIDPYLKNIFNKVNEGYFNGLITECNLKWGTYSKRTLGHYSFGSDTITISKIFQDIPEEDLPLIESVMYHEMLHKKHKFDSDGIKNRYHTTKFREDERKFRNNKDVEKRINLLIRNKKHNVKNKNIKITNYQQKKNKWFNLFLR